MTRAAEHPESPDTERFRLRRFLEALPDAEVQRVGPTDLIDVAAILEGNARAVVFESAGASPGATGLAALPLVGNANASRSRLALAFETTEAGLLAEVRRRLAQPGKQVLIERGQAPVQQVVLTGEDVDITRLPVHLQHALDGAPYVSAGIDYALDPESGWTNVGVRRLMLRSATTAGVDVQAPSDLRALYEREVARGKPLPVAFTVGAHPIDFVAAVMRIPTDELDVLARLRGAPLPLVKCVSNDVLVPADAELVIEGYLDEAGYVEQEGPYGEFLGYYGEVKKNPIFHITAITHRHDAVFQTATISGRTMARTDTAQLCALRAEVVVWKALESAVREVHAVYALASTGGSFHVRVAIRARVPGEAGNAIAAVFGCLANVKHVYVTDPDIDIFSDEQMEWAMATRFSADRDLVIQSGLRAMPLDPALEGNRTWTKAGFDLTRPVRPGNKPDSILQQIPAPPVAHTPLTPDTVEALLARGPCFFIDLMHGTGSRDGREIVAVLERLRASGCIDQDAEGRYRMTR
jgi:UbiD family decarboxylase